MKLCIVSSGGFFSYYGGGQVYVRNIVDELAKRKEIRLFVASRGARNCVGDYDGVAIHEYVDEAALRGILTTQHPDLVHAHGDKLHAVRVCRALGIPCVVTAHHGGLVCPAGTLLNTRDEICRIPAEYTHCLRCYLRNTPTGTLWYPLVKQYSEARYIRIGQRLRRRRFIPFLSPIGQTGMIVSQKIAGWRELNESATLFVAPSEAIAEALRRNGCPDGKVSVLPHGVPAGGNRGTASQDGNVRFYYVGRICYVKGIHVMLKAFHTMKRQNVELHVVGGAVSRGERRYMNRLQRRYRRDRRIVWHGKVDADKVAELTQPYDALAHPAIYLEAFGLDIAEALAAGKYVIATRCGGAEMQLRNEGEGLLVAPNDPMALREAMEQFAEKPRRTTAEVKSMPQHIEELLQLYRRTTTCL